jgi:hypothetical protein
VNELSVADGGGQTGKIEVKDDRFTLPISGMPQYVTLGQARLR